MKKKCYYSVVHYVPNVIRGEFINIGVVIQCREGGVVRCRLLENGEKITRFDQRANPRRTEDMLADLAQRLNVELERADIASENFLCELSRAYSNHI